MQNVVEVARTSRDGVQDGVPCDGPLIENLLSRFDRLAYRWQMAVLVEVELLWPEDLGLPLGDVVSRCVERAGDHELFCDWIQAVERAESHNL